MPDSRRKPKRTSRSHARHRFELRIIAGKWRGRRLAFSRKADVRPTPDRVRETLFNWLQSNLAGSRCLDLYAGSGALGLEALSRGAASVVFVDSSAAVARKIEEILRLFQCDSGRVVRADARRFLMTESRAYDIVFLDPPFSQSELADDCQLIADRGLLAPGGFVYLEGPVDRSAPQLPAGWEVLHSKQAGEVGYHLARHAEPGAGGGDGDDQKN